MNQNRKAIRRRASTKAVHGKVKSGDKEKKLNRNASVLPSSIFDADPESAERLFALIRVHTQLDPAHYKLTTVYRRIQRSLATRKFKSLADYVRFLEVKPEEVKMLAEDLFIHVTEFFRDPASFEVVAREILPKLLKQKPAGAPLRLWVAGCATGEEAYSLAMLILELEEREKKPIPYQIFATDISEETIQTARAGVFKESQLGGVSPARLQKYFEPHKQGYKVQKAIRDCCVFSRHDVLTNPPFAKIDLISCRNVLIYFDSALQQRVMPVFHYALNPNSYLWLGRSEAPAATGKLFSVADKVHKIYTKVASATPFVFRFPPADPLERGDGGKKLDAPVSFADQQKEVDRVIMTRFSPSGVVVNSDMEIIQVRGHTTPYLELPNGQPNYNLFKMIRPELLPSLRMALQTAQRDGATVRKEELPVKLNGEHRLIDMEVVPINFSALAGERQFLILFIQSVAKASPSRRKRAKGRAVPEAETQDYVSELLREIDSMREYQQHLTEGYEAAQEDLTATNEELQSTLEEFQSNNEELETAKEELQASNEELTTVNGELQARADELSASEERFRLLIDAVKDYAIFMLDPDGRVSTWNEAARRILGYEAQEILGVHMSRFFPSTEVAAGKPQRELELARTEGRYEEESVRIRKSGAKFFANVIITAIRDEAGNLRGFAKVTRDVSGRKVQEQALMDSEERYRLMVEVIKDYAIYRLDTAGVIVTWNEGAKNLKGYEAAEVVGKHFSIFYSKEDVEKGKPGWEVQQAINFGKVEDEGWRVRKDGTKFWANVVLTSIRDAAGDITGFTKITRDLTVKKAAEEALRQSEERFRLMVAGVKDYAIFMLDPEWRIATWNEGAKKLKGYSAQEIIGQHFSIFYPPEDVAAGKTDMEVRVATAEGRVEDEGWRVRKDGTRFWANVVITRIDDGAGNIVGFAKVTRDLTERKRMEEELRRSRDDLDLRVKQRTVELEKAVRARDEFISVASHELKTPLTTLKLEAQLAQYSLEKGDNSLLNPDNMRRFTVRLDAQVEKLRGLVEDMLDVARTQTGTLTLRPVSTNLSELTAEVIELFQRELESSGSKLVLDIEPGIEGTWDRARIEQIVLNLLTNAAKFGLGKPIEVRLAKVKDAAILTVKDQGRGIAEKDRERIFERFERAIAASEVSGLGLGLYITRELLKLHHGTIHVVSQLGRGSEFVVVLPLQPRFVVPVKEHKDYEF